MGSEMCIRDRNEVVLLPKETKLVGVKFETWKGKVTNMRHKPALITTSPEFQDVGIAIDEVTQSAHNNNVKVRVTNTSKEGIVLPDFAPVAKLQLISTLIEQHQEGESTPKVEVSQSINNEASRQSGDGRQEQGKQERQLDLEPANVCLCQIPNKFFITDVFGNNNQGLRHENTALIIDKLKQEARKAG